MRGAGHSDRRGRASARRPARGTALLALLALASPAFAVDLNGGFTIFRSVTDSESLETDIEEQQATINLFQDVTPFLSARFSYTHFEFDQQNDQGADLTRSSREPRLDLIYGRERLSARLAYQERSIEGTAEADNFEVQSLQASLSWRPRKGPGFSLSFRDESNVADVGVFGRENDSRILSVESFYDREWGGLRYAFRRNSLDSRTSGLESKQNRHELRAYVSRSILDDGVRFDFSSSVSRLDRRTDFPVGAEIGDPVRAREGLFAVDPSPEIGELDPAPGLIDGDTLTPAAPGIDIGGANTFRNIGLDLGVAAPVTRIEVYVDSVSSDLSWEVYRSPDNLIWESVAGVDHDFDVALLRFTLRFPSTTDRYFKVVNVSVNTEPQVRVTEARALLDIEPETDRSDFESTLYRADLGVGFRPTPGISGRFEIGLSNDQDLANGFVRRDAREVHATARWSFRLKEDLRLNVGYRFNDSELLRAPALLRTENAYNASLAWSPLPTVDAIFALQKRDESEREVLLQSGRSARLLLSTVLLPEFRVVSDLQVLSTDDPFSGFERKGWVWRETVSTRPSANWTFGGTYSVSRYETADGGAFFGGDLLRKRTEISLRTDWAPTAFLSLGGTLALSRDDGRETVRQSYNLFYTPGPKLNVSAVYQDVETLALRGTTNDSVTVGYRLNKNLSFFGSLSRSKTDVLGNGVDELTSLRMGLRFFI